MLECLPTSLLAFLPLLSSGGSPAWRVPSVVLGSRATTPWSLPPLPFAAGREDALSTPGAQIWRVPFAVRTGFLRAGPVGHQTSAGPPCDTVPTPEPESPETIPYDLTRHLLLVSSPHMAPRGCLGNESKDTWKLLVLDSGRTPHLTFYCYFTRVM